MAPPRILMNPHVSAIINLIAIFVIITNFVQNYALFHHQAVTMTANVEFTDSPPPQPMTDDDGRTTSSSSSSSLRTTTGGVTIPRGRAVALPSIPTTAEEAKVINRGIYGGKGDKAHLGGFTDFDPQGVSPSLWKHLISYIGVRSVLDVGCGKGVSTSWFVTHGLEYVRCVEGSHDAVVQSLVPGAEEVVVEHDFSRGAWWPERTVDAAWCVEFTEHVGRNYQPFYLPAFRSAALVFVTHSNWGGWHHVEVHNDDWWRTKWEAAGFVYSESLTKESRKIAKGDSRLKNLTDDMEEDAHYFVGQHLYTTLQVFINPMVASLPEHAHLFAEHGCFVDQKKGNDCEIAMANERNMDHLTPLPESFRPKILTKEMDDAWFDIVKGLKAKGTGRKEKDLR